jgi:hypothetical protein
MSDTATASPMSERTRHMTMSSLSMRQIRRERDGETTDAMAMAL